MLSREFLASLCDCPVYLPLQFFLGDILECFAHALHHSPQLFTLLVQRLELPQLVHGNDCRNWNTTSFYNDPSLALVHPVKKIGQPLPCLRSLDCLNFWLVWFIHNAPP